MIFCFVSKQLLTSLEVYSFNIIDHKHTLLIWTEWSFYTFQNGHHEISTTTKNTTHHRNNSKLKLMRWRNEIRAFTSKLTTHCSYNFPFLYDSCFQSTHLRRLFYFFLLKFKKELKNTTTLIFCMYIGLSSCTIYGSSCCLLVVVKGDVDCI